MRRAASLFLTICCLQILDAPRGRTPAPPPVVTAPPAEADDTAGAEPPRIARKPEAPEVPQRPDPAWPVSECTLESIECNGKQARLHVQVSGELRIFVIADPALVLIRGGEGAPVEFKCGKQTPRTVRIGYQAMPNAPGVAGEVRAQDFP